MTMHFSYRQLLSNITDRVSAGAAQRLPDFPQVHTKCLVLGPPDSGLSGLALQYAVNQVLSSKSDDAQVFLLCRKATMEETLPVLAPATADQQKALHQVKIRFLASHVEVQQYCACLHMANPQPHALVLHGLTSFFPQAMDRQDMSVQLARTLASLVDAADCVRQATGRPCPLLLTEETPASTSPPDMFFLMQRWLPLVLDITGMGTSSLWSLGVHPNCFAAASLSSNLQQSRVMYKLDGSITVT